MENIFNCDYEILLGISLLENTTFEEKVAIAKSSITYSDLEKRLGSALSKKWEKELKWADDETEGVYKGHIFVYTEDYPKSLLEYSNPPFVLSYRGAKPIGCCGNFKKAQSLTIVGTRNADLEGRQASFLLALEASSNNIVVYSGYATGIDQASHKGAAISGGITFAVMPCGLAHSYSYRNKELMELIYSNNGGFISQFSSDEEPYKWNFHYRNKILAQISDATVIVQAPEESGALITVRDALDSGKDVFVHNAGSGTEAHRKGTQNLINDGAISINNYHDLSVYTLGSFHQTKHVSPIKYSEIEAILSSQKDHSDFYRFADNWYHII